MRTPDARSLGILALALLILLALPGIALSLRYAPSPDAAHDAVVASDAGPLRFARGMHFWAASLVLVLLLLHIARAYVAGRIDVPGRRAALGGLAALAILVFAFFTGTILPWDQQGWEAFVHLRDGAGILRVPLGTETPADTPLRAIFFLHIFLVPAALLALLALHLRRKEKGSGARRLFALARAHWRPLAGILVIVALLARLAPPLLGPAPLEGLQVSRPDWPFLWLVPLQDKVGSVGLFALPLLLLGAGLLLWHPSKAPPRRRAIATFLAMSAFVGLSFLGAR